MPRQQQPDGIRLAYYAQLKEIHNRIREAFATRVYPLLPEVLSKVHPAVRTDADPASRLLRLTRSIQAGVQKTFDTSRLTRLTRKIANATSEHQKSQLFKQVKAGTGVELETVADRGLGAQIKQFTAENVHLIKTAHAEMFAEVEKVILEGMKDVSRHENLADEIDERLDVGLSRAKLIARDQVGKFMGNLNRVRQQDLGINKYTWRTANDDRVRDAHRDFEGNVYSWDDPPGDGSAEEGTHPGTAINDRCYAEPYLDELLEEGTEDVA